MPSPTKATSRSAARAAKLAAAVQAVEVPPAIEVPPAKKPTKKPAPRGTRPGGPPAGTDWLPTYLPRELHDAMRDAYVWELDNTNDPVTSLPRWIGRAILAHAARTPQERAALDDARPAAEVPGLAGHLVRPYTVPQEALDALEAVEQADRLAGRNTVRNGTVATAVWVAVEGVRRHAGGVLPHYAGRLPSKPNPARQA